MRIRGVSVNEIKDYLNLSCVQSVYKWLNGKCMPTVDNLYGLSALLNVSMEFLVCGTRDYHLKNSNEKMNERLFAYYAGL